MHNGIVRSKAFSIFAALSLASLLLISATPGCHRETPLAPSPHQQPAWKLVDHTDCKSQTNAPAGATVPSDMDCIEYHYRANGTLAIKRINAAFNCCPGDISTGIIVADGVITIVEQEAQSMCDCSCLYDLEYEIKNLAPRKYRLRIVELYLDLDDRRLEFPIDLSATPDGFAGRYRDHYPWMYQSTMLQDKAVLDAMRGEIIDFIGTLSCNGGMDCRYIPFGVKPCGGPWEHLIYSTATVDTHALEFEVHRYDVFNDAYNRRYNIASDCRYVLPPRIGCLNGICTDLDRRP